MKFKQSTLVIALVVSILAWVLALGIALSGCAASPKKLHGSVPVSLEEPTLVLVGPAKGHWSEESEQPIVAYVVRGTDCKQLSAAGTPAIDSSGQFELGENETLCVLPLRRSQRVAFHGVRS